MHADYSRAVRAAAPREPRAAHASVFFPGSTIGNFEPLAAQQFLSRMAELAGRDGVRHRRRRPEEGSGAADRGLRRPRRPHRGVRQEPARALEPRVRRGLRARRLPPPRALERGVRAHRDAAREHARTNRARRRHRVPLRRGRHDHDRALLQVHARRVPRARRRSRVSRRCRASSTTTARFSVHALLAPGRIALKSLALPRSTPAPTSGPCAGDNHPITVAQPERDFTARARAYVRGAIAGATASGRPTYLFDPQSGRRRRAELRDRTLHSGRRARELLDAAGTRPGAPRARAARRGRRRFEDNRTTTRRWSLRVRASSATSARTRARSASRRERRPCAAARPRARRARRRGRSKACAACAA